MRRAVPILALAAATLTISCIELTIDGSALGSVEFVQLPSPSIVVGDTLRDSSGNAFQLATRVYLADGTETTTFPVTYVLLDTFADLKGDYLIARSSLDLGTVPKQRIAATVGGLQSLVRTVVVVPRPDSLRAVGPLVDTIEYRTPSTAADTSVALAVRVVTGSTTLLAGVRDYVVTYRLRRPDSSIVPAADTSRNFWLLGTGDRATAIDTTDASGNASRRLRFRLRAGQAAIDTMLVEAEARLGARLLPGSPVRFTVLIQPRPAS